MDVRDYAAQFAGTPQEKVVNTGAFLMPLLLSLAIPGVGEANAARALGPGSRVATPVLRALTGNLADPLVDRGLGKLIQTVPAFRRAAAAKKAVPTLDPAEFARRVAEADAAKEAQEAAPAARHTGPIDAQFTVSGTGPAGTPPTGGVSGVPAGPGYRRPGGGGAPLSPQAQAIVDRIRTGVAPALPVAEAAPTPATTGQVARLPGSRIAGLLEAPAPVRAAEAVPSVDTPPVLPDANDVMNRVMAGQEVPVTRVGRSTLIPECAPGRRRSTATTTRRCPIC